MAAPRGGLARMSRRVMNLAHMLTQNARRHGDRVGFIWGDRSWTWREIDAPGFGARGGTGRARHRQGRPHPGPFQELRRDVLVDVRGVPVGRGLGADQFPPDAGRGRLSRHRLRREGVSVPRRFSRPRHGCGKSRRCEFIWRIGEGGFGEKSVSGAIAGACGREGRERGGRVRRSLLVLLHLRHHGPLQGGGADPWPDGLRRHQPSRRPDARHHRDRTPRWWSRRCRMAPACTSWCRPRAACRPSCCRRKNSTSRKPSG